MLFEGVSFSEPAVKQWKKEDFIRAHMDVLWQDREPSAREKMLSDVYDGITGAKAVTEAPEQEKAKEAQKKN